MSGCSLLPVGPCALGYAWVPWLEALSPYSWVSTHLLGHRRDLASEGVVHGPEHPLGAFWECRILGPYSLARSKLH